MRKFTLLLSLVFLFGCPKKAPEKPEEAKDDTSKQASTEDKEAPPEKPSLDVSIFGFNAKTAMYTKGKDGKSDTIELSGVDDSVYSPDGKNTAEMMKVIESNMFPDGYAAPKGYEGDLEKLVGDPIHAWIHWMDDKQVEVSIRNPFYSEGAGTLKFDVEIIDGNLHEGSLGKVEFRVQDCPDRSYVCAKSTLTACNNHIGPVGTCWNWLEFNCIPCHCDADLKLCVEKNPKCCKGDVCDPAWLGRYGWNRYCL